MTRYLLGLLLAAIALGPIVAASRSWRGRLLPLWSGAPAALADIVLALATVSCAAELLGAVGLFGLVPMTAGLALIGWGAWFAAHRNRDSATPRRHSNEAASAGMEPVQSNSRPALFAALAGTSVVIADWSTRTVDALHHGMTTPDTIWYHMPFAARFVQEGSITSLHFVDFGSDIAYYPQNGELLHALGILYLGNDFLSPLLNMGWLALALLAAWCVGRPFGVAPVTLTGLAVLMATPGLVATQPGGAYTDIVGFALLTSAVALLVSAERSAPADRLPAYSLAALAAGLALGTKLTFVAPIIALTLGVWVIAPRAVRWRLNALWLVLVVLAGGFWYLRNLVTIGNFLPFALRLGPIRLPSPPGLAPSSTVASFILKPHDWRSYFLPGLRESLGPAWWAVLGLAAAGLILGAIGGGNRLHRMLAVVGIVSGMAFVFSPQPLLEFGVPYNFVYNLRYSFSALIIGLVMLPILPMMARPRAQWSLLGAFGSVLIATQFDSTIWPTSFFAQQFGPPIHGIDSQIGLGIGVITFALGSFALMRGTHPFVTRRSVTAIFAAGTVVAALGVGFGLQQIYLTDRYQNTTPMAPLYAWAQHVHDTRMAITGPFTNDSYPLYGRDDSNYVQIVGERGPHGAFSPVSACEEFWKVIRVGHYNDVVTVTGSDGRTAPALGSQALMWVEDDPTAKLIFRRTVYGYLLKETVFSVFRLHGLIDPSTCAGPRK